MLYNLTSEQLRYSLALQGSYVLVFCCCCCCCYICVIHSFAVLDVGKAFISRHNYTHTHKYDYVCFYIIRINIYMYFRVIKKSSLATGNTFVRARAHLICIFARFVLFSLDCIACRVYVTSLICLISNLTLP